MSAQARLEELLGPRSAEDVAGLPEADARLLADAFEAAAQRQADGLAGAVAGASKVVPLPLRGLVRKAMGA